MEQPTNNNNNTQAANSAAQPFVNFSNMTRESLMEKLEQHGYCVVKGVLTPEKTEKFTSDFFTFMEKGGSGIKRDDPRTLTWNRMPFNRHGLLQHYQIGHAKFIWEIRSDPSICRIFETIWGTDRLLVSFDGACFAIRDRAESTDKPWHHLDQGHEKRGFQCVQGSINLRPCGKKKQHFSLLLFE